MVHSGTGTVPYSTVQYVDHDNPSNNNRIGLLYKNQHRSAILELLEGLNYADVCAVLHCTVLYCIDREKGRYFLSPVPFKGVHMERTLFEILKS